MKKQPVAPRPDPVVVCEWCGKRTSPDADLTLCANCWDEFNGEV